MEAILLYNPSPFHESLAPLPPLSFLSLVQSINRHLAAMEGPSTRIIQNKAFGCVKDRLGTWEDVERERNDAVWEDERRDGERKR